MGRKMKKLTRAGAGALAGVMVFGLAAPLAPLSVEAADEVKNLAIGSTATVNDKETDYWGADRSSDFFDCMSDLAAGSFEYVDQ